VPRGCTIGPEQRRSFVILSRGHFGARPASLDDPNHPITILVRLTELADHAAHGSLKIMDPLPGNIAQI
jgi:hypothetical protein